MLKPNRGPLYTMEVKTTLPSGDEFAESRKPASLLIAQFFLFPLIIIAICVGIFLLFGYLTYEQKSPRDYLNEVRAASTETRRWQAAFELSNIIAADKDRLSDTNFVQDVIAVYRSSREEDPRVRQFLALTMGRLGDADAVPALVDGLNDETIENQIYTLWALGTIGDNSAVPAILNQLRNDDPAVRKTAAYVLGAMKDPVAARDLRLALNDIKDDVQWTAAMSLAQLNDASGAGILMQLIDRSYLAGGGSASGTLAQMTPEQKTELMVNAVKCLAKIKFQPAHDRILALSQNDPDLAVRDASLEALKKFEM